MLCAIMRHVAIVVPDECTSLAAALRRALPWQRVLLRRGEHLVDGREDGAPGSSVLRVSKPVDIMGEAGAVLHGTLVFEAGCAGGAVRNVRIDDGGDCCLRCEGGTYTLSNVRLRCSHGSAITVSGTSRVELNECVLGGEGDEEVGQHVMLSAYGSVQDHGLNKRACYAVVAKDSARVSATGCALRQCSEAAVLVANASFVLLESCRISECPAAFLAGQGLGRSLSAVNCAVEGSARKLWADADRPLAFTWGDGNRREALLAEQLDESLSVDIVPPAQPRGVDDGDSSEEGSLEDATAFANMEALMEELDNAALEQAQSAALSAPSADASAAAAS